MGFVLCGALYDEDILCPIYMQESTREVIVQTVDFGYCYISNILIPEDDEVCTDAEGDINYYIDYLNDTDTRGIIKTEHLSIYLNTVEETATFISEDTLEEVNKVTYDLDTEFSPDEEEE